MIVPLNTRWTKRRLAIAALALLVALIPSQAPAESHSGPAVAWVDYQKGMALRGQSKKPLMIFFSLSYCYRCKEMKSWVYTDAQVAQRLNRDFVPVLVDIGQAPQAKRDFNIDYIPTHIFLAPDGRQVLRESGVITKDRFLKMLEFVAQGKYRDMDFKTYMQR
jgi:thioredoxin-related protein